MYRDFGKTLAAKRKEKHLNQLQLADLLNKKGLEVKSGSISKWEKNVNSPNVIQFFALCEILGIDNINDTFGIAIEENLFAQLNDEGKRKTIEYMNLLIKSGMYVREEPVYITNRTLKVFTEPASAGTGLFLDSDQYEEFEVGDDVPATADFGIRVSGDRILQIAVPYSKGWRAWVDGVEQPVFRCGGMYMGMQLEAGEHDIEMRYITPGLIPGAAVSCAALLLFAALWIAGCRRRRRGPIDGDRESAI